MSLRCAAFGFLFTFSFMTTQASATELATGARVRVITVKEAVGGAEAIPSKRPHEVIGTLVRLRSDELRIQTSAQETVRVPVAEVSRLDVSNGRRSNARKGGIVGAAFGGVLGIAVGALAGAFANDESSEPGNHIPESIAYGFAFGAASGALIGLGIGSMSQGDDWREVSKPWPTLRLTPIGREGLSLRVSVPLGG